MYIYNDLLARAAANTPVRVGLIGAGKFGSMFLSQVPTTPALEVSVIADLNPAGAQQSCLDVGWAQERVNKTRFVDDAMTLLESDDVDVVVEATGNPVVGLIHALSLIHI